ncbi:oxidoreductase-like protein [Bisporella sp. PMI_857]|nr:oxidoreductase-like protein [Bisporella sp. PMI_857]
MSVINKKLAKIPVVDITCGGAPADTYSDVAKALCSAAYDYGFVYIRNQGKDIPIGAIDRAFELSKSLFASPVEEKEPCKITENNRGWSGMHTETLDAKNQRVGDFKEAFNLGEFVKGKAQQPLPAALVDHESFLHEFQHLCHCLVLKILTLFAVGLEIRAENGGANWFKFRHEDGPTSSILRLLYYPAIKPSENFQPSVDIRAGAHSDYGSITLLFQRPGQPGLEIVPPSTLPADGVKDYGSAASWTPVAVYPPGTESDPSPPILVNIGDLLCYWTNGLLKSTVHRVVFPQNGPQGGEDRYSIAYFAHPRNDTVLEPIPSTIVSSRKELSGIGPEGKKSITAAEHLMGRLKATYLNLYNDDDEKK